MPKALKRDLKRRARKKFPGDKDTQNAYVYGTLNKIESKKRVKKTKL
mgnify:FL=1|jgi:hypothetical protein|tara:strand:+ start:231 stop:371 length:141 start_codon:yes stop_codon:yes gene_type:complete